MARARVKCGKVDLTRCCAGEAALVGLETAASEGLARRERPDVVGREDGVRPTDGADDVLCEG